MKTRLNKRLTKHMEETLMDCHERELLGKIHAIHIILNLQRACTRGVCLLQNFMCVQMVKQKQCFYVTPPGKNILKSLTETRN